MRFASQAGLGSLGLFSDPMLPVGRLPYHRRERGRVCGRVPCLENGRQGARAPRGRSTKARVCRTLLGAAHRAASVHECSACDLEGPMNGWIRKGIAASGAARLSNGAGGWCGSRPLTAASWLRAIGYSARPACDAWILWQAHKARGGVDTIAAGHVKREELTVKSCGLAPVSLQFDAVANSREG